MAAVVGCTLVAGGLLLLVLPGPGLLTIAAGVAVLAAEFALPRRLLRWAMARAQRLRERWRR
ncbi:MAG: PGPGW domain-containing protein [Candidatus Dormibacteraceae bacterium]